MTDIAELMFFNYDATPREVKFNISPDGIDVVMSWYGAYFAGDRYNVFVNGKRVEKDHNGDRLGKTIEGAVK